MRRRMLPVLKKNRTCLVLTRRTKSLKQDHYGAVSLRARGYPRSECFDLLLVRIGPWFLTSPVNFQAGDYG